MLVDPVSAMRRGDLLAALCQESQGDMSTVSRAELSAAEAPRRANSPQQSACLAGKLQEELSGGEKLRRVEKS